MSAVEVRGSKVLANFSSLALGSGGIRDKLPQVGGQFCPPSITSSATNYIGKWERRNPQERNVAPANGGTKRDQKHSKNCSEFGHSRTRDLNLRQRSSGWRRIVSCYGKGKEWRDKGAEPAELPTRRIGEWTRPNGRLS